MSPVPILIWSHFKNEQHASPFDDYVAQGKLREIWEGDVTQHDIEEAPAAIITMHIDQNRAVNWLPWFSKLLDRGGRIAINGHVIRPYLEGVGTYIPAEKVGKSGLLLTVLGEHPIFEGIDRVACGVRKGVAGFYGRGHNQMPSGAVALTGVGPAKAPLDWIWQRPAGGEIFSHAGNDIWNISADEPINRRLTNNLVNWVNNAQSAS
ncbi:hypothetical protein WJT86_03865 [Microvirga sp. W0021]|uniref:Uncharacterized protein n=1 Tax=Hohaiivirga grylli TaxID=3133970 RepID=A0ABV0BIW3_9HYPH